VLAVRGHRGRTFRRRGLALGPRRLRELAVRAVDARVGGCSPPGHDAATPQVTTATLEPPFWGRAWGRRMSPPGNALPRSGTRRLAASRSIGTRSVGGGIVPRNRKAFSGASWLLLGGFRESSSPSGRRLCHAPTRAFTTGSPRRAPSVRCLHHWVGSLAFLAPARPQDAPRTPRPGPRRSLCPRRQDGPPTRRLGKKAATCALRAERRCVDRSRPNSART
jgi:hypothetical protein